MKGNFILPVTAFSNINIVIPMSIPVCRRHSWRRMTSQGTVPHRWTIRTLIVGQLRYLHIWYRHHTPVQRRIKGGRKGHWWINYPFFLKCFMYLHVILITSEITPISKIIMQFWNKFQILSTWKAIHNLTRCTTLIKCYIAMAKHYAKKHVLKSSKCEHLETLY